MNTILSAQTTHELYELLSMKKMLDTYRGGPYFAALNQYIEKRILELLSVPK